MTRYQAILFDLDGTLRESDPRFMDALQQCLDDAGIPVAGPHWRLTERWVHRYWAQSPELQEDAETHGMDQIWLRFLTRLMARAGHTLPPAAAAAFDAHLKERYQPRSYVKPGVPETLNAFRAAGMILGVLSNRSKPFTAELEELGLVGSFDFTLAAGEIGVWKPRPEIFHEALTRGGGIAPTAALYVGDNYYADILGAANAGIDAVLVDDRAVFTDVSCSRVERIDQVVALVFDD